MLIKKRIVVYCSDSQKLLSTVRVIPQLAIHRQDWEIVRPWIHLEEEELEDITSAAHFVAGCTDDSIEAREDLYDVFVNVDAGSVNVASHAASDFNLGKIHKEIAMWMQEAAEDESMSNPSVVKVRVSRRF